jgi:hypothetical protein
MAFAITIIRYHNKWLRNLLIAASLNSMFKFLSENITCNDKSKVAGFAENTTNIKILSVTINQGFQALLEAEQVTGIMDFRLQFQKLEHRVK